MLKLAVMVACVLALAAVAGALYFRAKPGPSRRFLGVAFVSAVAFPVCAVLHNAVSAIFHVEEAVFFLLAVFGAPLGVLVGFAGAAVAGMRSRPTPRSGG